MKTVKTRRRILIEKIEINGLERQKEIEIKLPSNVSRVTGIIITNSL
jgi:hypothetical protein